MCDAAWRSETSKREFPPFLLQSHLSAFLLSSVLSLQLLV